MAQKVRKAVIPAAGLGTRVLPASKAVPKEMLPIVDKPANRGKGVIEDHFDHVIELEQRLEAGGKQDLLQQVRHSAGLANIFFLRQKETRGLGHAVNQARSFVGDEPFAVLYGDDVIISEDPVCGQLCRAYEKYGRGVVGMKEVTEEQIRRYSSLKVDHIDGNDYHVTDMIEKPATKGQILSMYSVLLDRTAPGAGGEIQLTDAMCELARTEGMTGVDFVGTRYDMGNKLGILQATCEVALAHPEVKEDFAAYLKELVKTL